MPWRHLFCLPSQKLYLDDLKYFLARQKGQCSHWHFGNMFGTRFSNLSKKSQIYAKNSALERVTPACSKNGHILGNTLPETKNSPISKGDSSSKYWFSGATLVSGRVEGTLPKFFLKDLAGGTTDWQKQAAPTMFPASFLLEHLPTHPKENNFPAKRFLDLPVPYIFGTFASQASQYIR